MVGGSIGRRDRAELEKKRGVMNRGRIAAVAGSVLVAVTILVRPAVAQDLNTMLVKFLVDLKNGTLGATQTITSIAVGNGAVGTPAVTFSAEAGLGLFRPGAGYMAFGELGNMDWAVGGNNFIQASTGVFGWVSSTNPYSGTLDTTVRRAAAGELTYTTVAFAALGTPANGTLAFCTDCAPTTPASCPGTKASCVCAGSGVGSLAVRQNNLWYCPF